MAERRFDEKQDLPPRWHGAGGEGAALRWSFPRTHASSTNTRGFLVRRQAAPAPGRASSIEGWLG